MKDELEPEDTFLVHRSSFVLMEVKEDVLFDLRCGCPTGLELL
jgi:hypothetical protein